MNTPQTVWEQLLGFLDSLCSSYLSIQQARSPEGFEGRGVVIPEAQVTAALRGQQPIAPWPDFEDCFDRLRKALETDHSPMGEVVRSLALKPFALLCLLLAYAPDYNRKYERVFGYLQDNISEKHATLGLAADLFSLLRPVEERELFALCDMNHPLNRYVLEGDIIGLSRPLRLRETALLYLSGASQLPDSLQAVCTLLPRSAPCEPIVRLDEFERGAEFVRLCLQDTGEHTGLMMVYGAEGTGRRFLLQYAAKKSGRDLLCIDCEGLCALSAQARAETICAAVSHCKLTGAVPALVRFDLKGYSEVERLSLAQGLLAGFGGQLPLLGICGQDAMKLRYDRVFKLFWSEQPRHSMVEQRAFWLSFSKDCTLPSENLDFLQLANIFSLTPGQIRQVMVSADTASLVRGETSISKDEISAAVRQICRPRLSALTEPMSTPFTWDDLTLEDEALGLLDELCDRIRYRWRVNEEWGFDRKLPYGRGVSVLLYGPPGTGKTMTAQVLAREFGLDAYRVDLSRIMDKYIGETEKKLADLFDAAKDSNAILFFDEADALFAKRTEVSDSKDKYSNAETSYLLQRMEQHNGISILATNAAQNFDEAFKRRISYMVPISMPSPELRAGLWRKVFPAEAPLENVDFDFLAQRFELSGSSIKNVAVSAAFMAASHGSAITREFISVAIKTEYRKTGRVLMEHQLY